MAVWVAAGLFVLLVVVATFWRLDADALDSAEQDRDRAISKAVELERQLASRQDELNSLRQTVSDQRIENVALHTDLDACSDRLEATEARLGATLESLRTNLKATRPAPWKALAKRLLEEPSDA